MSDTELKPGILLTLQTDGLKLGDVGDFLIYLDVYISQYDNTLHSVFNLQHGKTQALYSFEFSIYQL